MAEEKIVHQRLAAEKPRQMDNIQPRENIDAKTGEVMDGFIAFVPTKRVSPYGKRWIAMQQDALLEVAKMNKQLGKHGLTVFAALAAYLDYENGIVVHQTALAKQLGIPQPRVADGIKRLLDTNVIKRGERVGRTSSYTLNPQLAWKGSHANLRKELTSVNEGQWTLIQGGKSDEEVD